MCATLLQVGNHAICTTEESPAFRLARNVKQEQLQTVRIFIYIIFFAYFRQKQVNL